MTGSDLTEAENLKTEDMHWYYDVARYDYQHDIWLLSRPFIKSQYYEDIVRKRQMNYRILKGLIHESKTLKPVFPYLSSGVCPLCFPIIVHQSDRFVRKLNRRGILPFVFGRFLHPLMNKANYPDAYFLSKSILGLPVHQQLGREEMYIIDEAVNEISRKNGKTN
jgi:dTDP-4-amino-4,6-dideoxygalactose transaminase